MNVLGPKAAEIMPRLSKSTSMLVWEQRLGAGTQAQGRRVLLVVQHKPLEATDDVGRRKARMETRRWHAEFATASSLSLSASRIFTMGKVTKTSQVVVKTATQTRKGEKGETQQGSPRPGRRPRRQQSSEQSPDPTQLSAQDVIGVRLRLWESGPAL